MPLRKYECSGPLPSILQFCTWVDLMRCIQSSVRRFAQSLDGLLWAIGVIALMVPSSAPAQQPDRSNVPGPRAYRITVSAPAQKPLPGFSIHRTGPQSDCHAREVRNVIIQGGVVAVVATMTYGLLAGATGGTEGARKARRDILRLVAVMAIGGATYLAIRFAPTMPRRIDDMIGVAIPTHAVRPEHGVSSHRRRAAAAPDAAHGATRTHRIRGPHVGG